MDTTTKNLTQKLEELTGAGWKNFKIYHERAGVNVEDKVFMNDHFYYLIRFNGDGHHTSEFFDPATRTFYGTVGDIKNDYSYERKTQRDLNALIDALIASLDK